MDNSDASSSVAFRLSDVLPSELVAPDASSAQASTAMPLAMAEQLAGPTGPTFSIGTSTAAESQPPKQRKPNRPRKPQANPNRVRNELRFELTYLREKVSQLEQELSSLQLQPRVKLLSNGQAGEVSSLQVSSSPHVLSAWKGVAGRQRQRREDAERENARLRLIVERQRKVAIDLSELLRKRVNIRREGRIWSFGRCV